MFGILKKKEETAAQPIYFSDSLTGEKLQFTSLKPGVATMYSCGPTVYDHIHIGNLRAFLLADIVKATLTYNGYTVKHTINFTDFGHLSDDGDAGEDKMMRALHREGKPVTLTAMRELAEIYITSFKEDTRAFRNTPPTTYAPASEYVGEQIELIKTLVEKGYAYEISDGVYFDVTKFPTYGQIGNVDIAKIKEGARVEVNPEKKHPADFALWKKGLLGWESDWGKGFPGWHIECTAMAFATLGKQIDIHTGGEDLKHTHHNGEIAQAEAITGKTYVQYWLHNAHISIDEQKISKSLGNGITLKNLTDRGYSPESYRYFLLQSHYRSPANFTFDALDGAKQALYRLKRYIFEEFKNEAGAVDEAYRTRFHHAINDDLNTPQAIAIMWEIVKDKSLTPGAKVATLKEIDSVLALGLNDTPDTVIRELGVLEDTDIPEAIQTLLTQREAARLARNWEEADTLREALNLKGYTVEDTPQGQKISKT
ncbi:MAG: cysteine--tRNA ligase [Candidatus Pacebacteria bacterium]|nr:cysteine--tRNA ligase [Candidatus Paceibacterota bacterium]